MMSRRHSEQEQISLVEEFISKGDMSVKNFCEDKGIDRTCLFRWFKLHGYGNPRSHKKTIKKNPKEKISQLKERIKTLEMENAKLKRLVNLVYRS